jgi:anhydro-N-acetylmuramic acid kinase
MKNYPMIAKQKYRVIGLMSGTSLDGLDIAYCTFRQTKNGWNYEIENATTLKYPATWSESLSRAHTLSGADLLALHAAYGQWLGKVTKEFVVKNNLKVDFIASHGHTIFHQPEKKFTFQLGAGNAIHAESELPVVFDFRALDVSLNGQGAPLVPIGDKLLFTEYDVCLNLGGIANLSTDKKKKRIAYDICFMNMGLNYLAGKAGKSFDQDGVMAESGEVNKSMLQQLDKVYSKWRKKRPSLAREHFEEFLLPILRDKNISLNDRLRTCAESSAKEIALAIRESAKNPKVLCTGGGALNSFFISTLLDTCGDDAHLIVPDKSVINFKEALVFAFLGTLRVRNEINSLHTVTGASRSTSSGVMVGFKN